MEELESPSQQTNKNWCCILSTAVLSGGLCFFGVSLVLKDDGRTGLVLLLSSGGLLALSVCAALGKCRDPVEEDKPQTPPLGYFEDRPPSYRLSWRRSFMRRLRHRSEDVEDGIDGGGGGGGGGAGGEAAAQEAGGNRRGWLGTGRGGGDRGGRGEGGRTRGGGNLSPPISSFPNPDSSSSLGSLLAAVEASKREGGGGGGGGGGGSGVGSECTTWGTRHTQSLSNLLDPPPYQEAVANLDEAAIRKLRSELCLPSAVV